MTAKPAEPVVRPAVLPAPGKLAMIAQPRMRAIETKRRAAAMPVRKCPCGKCKRCLDEARWEKIFKDKFVDANYYDGLMVRQQSTLAMSR
jgi:hypothetical protein